MSLESCISMIVTRRWLTILLSLLVMLVLAAGAARLIVVDVDFRNHFGESDPHLLALEQLEETYALSDVALVAVAPHNGTVFTKDALVAIEELTEQLWRTPYATRVDSISNYTHSEGLEDELVVEPLIEEAGSLSDTDIERIKDIALGTQEVAGRFISRDEKVAGLVVSIVLPDENRELTKREVTDYLYETVADARGKYTSIDYHLLGGLILNRVIGDALDDETAILGPIALGTMLLVALVLIRSIWGTLAIVLMILAVIPSALGFAGWTGLRLFGESGAALFVLMAVTVAHSVHIIEGMAGGLRQGMTKAEAAVHAVRVNVWPVFLTSFTTSIGFLSLNFVDMPPFRVMGNIVAFGSMCAFVFSVTLLPAFLSVLPVRARKMRENRLDFFDRLSRFVISYRTILLCFFGIVTIVLVAGIFKIELRENWLEVMDESYEFRRSADFLSKNFPGVETYEYSLDSGREGAVTDIEYLKQVEAFSDWYREQPEFVHIFSIADIMKRLNKNLHGDNPDYYALPDDPELAAQYLLLYEFSLPIGRDLNNLIDHDRRATRVTVSVKSMSSKEKIDLDNRARAWLQKNAPSMETGATGISIVGSHSIQRNIENMLQGTFVAMAIVSLLLFAIFRSIRLGLVSLIPNFLPAAMAMGLWGHLVGEVGVPAAVVTAIAFGIIVDDTIHFMTKYTDSRKAGKLPSESVQIAFRSVGRALFTTTIVFGLGFMVFGASGLVGNQVLGLLVGITVIIALVADFFFLPPLLMLLDETKETGEQIKERLRSSTA
ncbi:MAG: MMPL family transporter [Candidatus Dadabacteria bacterium]|nr:MMPL family transporter [Candidatus Dadabacteria bacterium]MDE0662755.1 MMPL family transporter [Candidatus Dadabacteria bacterium]